MQLLVWVLEYVKRRKGNKESIPSIKHHNGTIITDTTEKANILNSFYTSVFCCGRNILEIKLANSCETFIISTKVIRKRLAKFGRNTSLRPDGFPAEILKLFGKAITPYKARLLEVSLNNATIPRDSKIVTVVYIYKRENRSALLNYRFISLNSVVCNQLEHVLAGYLRQVWDKNDWLYEGQHGFRLGESCVIKVCQNIADFLDEGDCTDVVIINHNRLFQSVQLSSSWSAAYEIDGLGGGFQGSRFGKVNLCGLYTKGKNRSANIRRSQSNIRCATRERFGTVLFLVCVNDIWRDIDWRIRLFVGNCLIYGKITNGNDI